MRSSFSIVLTPHNQPRWGNCASTQLGYRPPINVMVEVYTPLRVASQYRHNHWTDRVNFELSQFINRLVTVEGRRGHVVTVIVMVVGFIYYICYIYVYKYLFIMYMVDGSGKRRRRTGKREEDRGCRLLLMEGAAINIFIYKREREREEEVMAVFVDLVHRKEQGVMEMKRALVVGRSPLPRNKWF